MSPLTADEQELIGSLWVSLCDSCPGRSFSIEVRPVSPAPSPEWIEIGVMESGRTVSEHVARGALRPRTLKGLRDSLLQSLRGPLEVPTAATAA